MSEFEKQNKEPRLGQYKTLYESEQALKTWEDRKEGWLAALRWVRNGVIPEAWDTIDVDDFIEEEIQEIEKGI